MQGDESVKFKPVGLDWGSVGWMRKFLLYLVNLAPARFAPARLGWTKAQSSFGLRE